MRIRFLLALLTLNAQCLQAELAWHEYDATHHIPRKISIDGAVVEVVQRDVAGSGFKEDNLTLGFSRNGSVKHNIWFTSSYGAGAIAMEGRWLFLRYGIGRGTFAREEHVRVYLVGQTNALEEMADMKISSYVDAPGAKSGDPILAEYKIHVSDDKAAITITFIPPTIKGIVLPEKTLRVTPKGEQVVDGKPPEAPQPPR